MKIHIETPLAFFGWSALMLLAGSCCTYFLVATSMTHKFQADAITHGAAHYDPVLREVVWNERATP